MAPIRQLPAHHRNQKVLNEGGLFPVRSNDEAIGDFPIRGVAFRLGALRTREIESSSRGENRPSRARPYPMRSRPVKGHPMIFGPIHSTARCDAERTWPFANLCTLAMVDDRQRSSHPLRSA